MKGKSPDPSQLSLLPQRLEDLVNPRHPLYRLSKRIPWEDLENHFSCKWGHKWGQLIVPISGQPKARPLHRTVRRRHRPSLGLAIGTTANWQSPF